MAGVDDRVVAMSFENSKFESGVATSLSTLDKLKKALTFDKAGAGLDDVSKKASGFHLGGIADAVEGIKSKFSTMGVAAVAAIGTIVTKATTAGLDIVKSLTIDPISAGLKEYETNIGSIQTVLANTSAAGTKLKDVNKALQDLNTYSDQTIYNFSQMAHNIGTFTAAGVDLKTATGSIKGIANLAALSGSNSEQASTAMYQLSQAISSGKVSLQDWNSVVNAGMGGTVFQRALANTAQNMGTLSDGAVTLKGKMKNVSIEGQSFRESIQAKPGEKSWLTSDVLTKTLQQFTGDLTDAQLKAEGFSDSQIKAIQDQAKMAKAAATEVKTLSGVLDTAKESAGSGWAQTWQIVFGDFNEAKDLFTGMSTAINGFIGNSAKARNSVLQDWKDLGGRTDLIEGIKNVFEGLIGVLKPIKEAFRQIFPAATGQQLADLTKKFRDFTESFKIGPETADKLKRSFAGLFAVFSIAKSIISGVFSVIVDLLGAVGSGSGGFLEITANIGDFLVKLDEAIKSGDGLKDFFSSLGSILATPIRLIGTLATAIGGLFGGFSDADSAAVGKSLDKVSQNLNPIKGIIDGVKKAWENFLQTLDKVKTAVEPIVGKIAEAFGAIGDAIADSFSGENLANTLSVIQTGLLGGIVLMVKRFMSKGVSVDIGGGILENVSKSFDALSGSLQAMQQNIKADTLMKIATAVALLAASIVALSLIDPEKLKSGMAALAVAFGQLLGAMAILNNITATSGFLKVPVIAASLILLAGAIDLLVLAVAGLSRLSWAELAKGLIGVGALLGMLVIAVQPLSAGSAGMIRAGIGITALAIGLNILALAVRQFGSMDWGTIGKGLVGVAGALVVIGLASRLFPTGMIAIGAGLVLVGVGLKVVASAVSDFGEMDWKTIAVGMGGIAAALLIIAGAMTVMPSNMIVQAAGLLIVAVALNGLAMAIKAMGGMSIESIAKGLGTLAASLVILAAGLTAMTGTLAGAAALGVAAGALTLLVPVLTTLGAMSFGSIAKGLGALAATFVLLGAAGLVLAPIIPALLGLGAAMLLIGGGFALAGAGVLAFSAGISALAVAGPAGIKLLVSALNAFILMIPNFVIGFVTGLLTMVEKLAELAPKFVAALGKILENLAQAIIVAAPKIAEAFGALVTAGVKILSDNAPKLVKAGVDLLKALLKGIADNIVDVTNLAVDIVLRFLGAIGGRISQIAQTGLGVLLGFLSGIANNMARVISTAVDIILHIVGAIGANLSKIVQAGGALVSELVRGISGATTQVIAAGAKFITDIIKGIGDNATKVATAGLGTARDFIKAVADKALDLVTTGGNAVLKFLEGVEKYMNENASKFGAAGRGIVTAMMKGVAEGLGVMNLTKMLTDKFSGALSGLKHFLKIKSPSQLFAEEIGEPISLGIAAGIDQEARALDAALGNAVDGALTSVKSSLSGVPAMLDGLLDMNPVITPVLDLSQIEVDAKRMAEMTNVVPITAASSFGQAAAISPQTPGTAAEGGEGNVFKFEQNNYSPEALSDAEIYRQTNNQLSQAKNALGL